MTSKYSHKIKEFIKYIVPFIKIDEPSKNTTLTNIYNSIISCSNLQSINPTQSSIINPIHDKSDYPLIYIFYYYLKKVVQSNKVIESIPDISEFSDFVAWYRRYYNQIDLNDIHSIIREVKKDTNDENYSRLMTAYNSIFNTSGIRSVLHKALYENSFIGIDVQRDLESSILEYSEYKLNDHSIHIFIPNDIPIKKRPKIEIIRQIILIMNNLAIKYGLYTPPVNLIILLSHQKKYINSNMNIICGDNLNSGSTYPGISITCWRREELYKVLIHELFHYYKFDFSVQTPSYNLLENMLLVPKINGFDAINESYTESIAIMIHTMIIASLYMNDHNNNHNEMTLDDPIKFWMSLLKEEIAFTMFQIAKIVNSIGTEDFNDIIQHKVIINQTTSFRSYFIIKLVLLLNLKELLDFTDENLVLNDDRIEKFGNLINRSYTQFIENDSYMQIMNILIYVFNENNNNNKWIYRTARMSANDLVYTQD
jgi:hypothetical protein